MSAYVIVESAVKDPDVYSRNTPLRLDSPQQSTEVPIATGRSSMALPCSRQESSCGLQTVRRRLVGTTRPNIST
jgi:hypothetical protein